MTGRLRRFFALAPARRRLLLQAWWLLCAARAGLWVVKLRVLERIIARTPSGRPAIAGDAMASSEIGWAVSVASGYVPASSCLAEALVARTLLQRAGEPARLVIGVASTAERGVHAHAWVESRDRTVIGGPDLDGYVPLAGRPGTGQTEENDQRPGSRRRMSPAVDR
jgi:hypothetical protein